ncbi:hypothetical protein [Methylorubrum sp. GM97]|uniref:hypothetical protein n=1 Tax=Methylorubrum sp. GM97 TaxID=2938232 RepID=UPI002187E736|nr:hypothetical protein [Methylorubrum sp. GM97]BDL39094.1 hypothetical protein MSPGM_16840 [Methylorubrum sp. GM97]
MANDSNIADDYFNGAAVWATLSAAQQARIGAMALELAVAGAIAEHAPDPAARAGAAAEKNAFEFLLAATLGLGGLLDRTWIDATGGKERYRIPSVIHRVCRACGCSQEDPCEQGCGWHDATTCIACVGSGKAAHG